MTARNPRAIRTGRAARVRAYLAALPADAAQTSRQILDAVEPGGRIDLMCATLGTLANAGHVVRIGGGPHHTRYASGTPGANPAPRRTAPPAREVPRSIAPAKPPRTRARPAQANIRKALRNVAAGKPAKSKRILAPATPAPGREQRNHFNGPVGMPTHASRARDTARQRIADDVAAFLKRGGRIERLGITPTFRHLDNHDDD